MGPKAPKRKRTRKNNKVHVGFHCNKQSKSIFTGSHSETKSKSGEAGSVEKEPQQDERAVTSKNRRKR